MVLSLAGGVRLAGQTANATVSGLVGATTGAAVPAAAIEVKNADTGVTRSAITDDEGRFHVSDLPIGNYEVQASKTGFTTVVHRGLTLSVGSQNVVDFSLPVGPTQQTITVEGMASSVETNSSAVSSMIDQTQISELPLNGRSFTHLLNMVPGVSMGMTNIMGASTMTMYGAGEKFSISGARVEGQAFLLDSTNIQGFWNRGTGSGAVGTTLGVEAVAGFQVLTSTYSAQFGGNGGVLNAATKSGTNSLHGSVYEYLRNSALNAPSFIDGSSPPPLRANQFGASAGGPIKKDKVSSSSTMRDSGNHLARP
jgi:carboxypeptidase family protein